jgi:hypothetical protein
MKSCSVDAIGAGHVEIAELPLQVACRSASKRNGEDALRIDACLE